MYTREYGTGNSTLIVLHGILGSSQNWHSIASELAESRQVLVPDLRNHGNSPHAPHSIEAMCDDLHRLFIDYELSNADLLGHSMGGLVAMLFAVKYKQRVNHLIIEDIAPGVNHDQILSLMQAMQSLDPEQITSLEDAGQSLSGEIQNKTVRQFILKNLNRRKDGSYHWQVDLENLEKFVRGPVFKLPENSVFEGPVMFLVGGQSDHNVLSKQGAIEKHFPAVQFRTIENAGHWLHYDAPEDFLKNVVLFLADKSI
jgi:pimeloyl-ACP methyl ester carboxylesterase